MHNLQLQISDQWDNKRFIVKDLENTGLLETRTSYRNKGRGIFSVCFPITSIIPAMFKGTFADEHW